MSVKSRKEHDKAPHYVVVFREGRPCHDGLVYRGRRAALKDAEKLNAMGYQTQVVKA